jgi:hypothetical protein
MTEFPCIYTGTTAARPTAEWREGRRWNAGSPVTGPHTRNEL